MPTDSLSLTVLRDRPRTPGYLATNLNHRLRPEDLAFYSRETMALSLSFLARDADGSIAPMDLSAAVGFQLAAKNPEDLDGALLASTTTFDLTDAADGILAIPAFSLATAELVAFIGSAESKRLRLELIELDAQGDELRILLSQDVALIHDTIQGDETPPTANGPETDLGNVGSSHTLDFNRGAGAGTTDQTTLALAVANAPGTGAYREVIDTLTTGGSACTVTLPTGVHAHPSQLFDAPGSREITIAANTTFQVGAFSSGTLGKTIMLVQTWGDVL